MRSKGTYAVTPALPGQVVLVLQGGGALGAYQVGVYEALHEAGIEPDWVIGTSIGAINAAIIAGNKPQDRVTRLCELWTCFQQPPQLRARHTGLFLAPNAGVGRLASQGGAGRGVVLHDGSVARDPGFADRS